MARPTVMRELIMAIHVSLVGRKDLNGEIYRQLRAAIRTGQLRPDEYLTPSRELARRWRFRAAPWSPPTIGSPPKAL